MKTYEIKKIEKHWTLLIYNENGEITHNYRFASKKAAEQWVRDVKALIK